MSGQFSAESPITDRGAQYHIQCKEGDLAKTVLLPGDPGRVEKIGSFWDEYEEVSLNRQYRSSKGLYKDIEISACSSGIGAPSTEIAIQELAAIGANTILRVGTTGSLIKEIECGDLLIAAAAMRMDGTSDTYVRKGYPAFANYEVVMALIEACDALGFRYHVGISACPDSFYLGQGRPVHGGYWPSWADNLIADLQQAKVTNFEMETSAVFVLSSLMGLRAGSIFAVIANRITDKWGDFGGELRVCEAACEAARILSAWDRLKSKVGVRYFYPSLLQNS